MMQLSMKAPLALLLGIFSLLNTESTSFPTPENNTISSTAEPNNTTKQLLMSATVHYETQTHGTSKSAESGAAATEPMDGAHVINSSSESTTAELMVTVKTTETKTSSSGGGLLHTSAAVLTTEVTRPNNTMVPEAAKPTDGEQTSTASTNMTAPLATPAATSAASSATTVSATQPTSTKMTEVTSTLFPNTSEASSSDTSVVTQTQTSPQALDATTTTKNTTTGGATVIDSTTQEKTTTETKPSITSEQDSTTRTPNLTVESTKPSTGHPTDSFSTNTTTNSTSPAAILIPCAVTPKSPATTSKTPPVTNPQPCSTLGVAKHCLIVIAILALLATIFMVTTIVLCTKLSGRKYKTRRGQPATEMMCISSLLPERNYTYTRQRNPVSNGVLVMHRVEDSDEDGGDNLTLSSFLPENDRCA